MDDPAMKNPPSRKLHLSSPLTTGNDVLALQYACNVRRRAKHLRPDGEYGAETRHEAAETAKALGLRSTHWTNGLDKYAQKLIRQPRYRTPLERGRAALRKKQGEAAARHKGGRAVAAFAVKVCETRPQREKPPRSNRGPLIDVMQKGVDMQAQPWCGAFVWWCVKETTGIDLDHRIRYCPYTESAAKSGLGGFKEWIPAARIHEAPVGSLLLWGSNEAKHVSILVSDVGYGAVNLRDAGGNTSSGNGSPSDGGMTAINVRSIKGGFPLRGAAVWRGI